MSEGGPTVMNEIADLLDQCTPEELGNILQAIETGEEVVAALPGGAAPAPFPGDAAPPAAAPAPPAAPSAVDAVGSDTTPASWGLPGQEQPVLAPLPPQERPPSGNRRPNPRAVKPQAPQQAQESPGQEQGQQAAGEANVSLNDLARILEQHSAGVLSEVRKLLPAAAGGGMAPTASGADAGDTVDMAVLTQALVERDEEVKQLENRLADLQMELAQKDKRVGELSDELENTAREVRHRQLDLEFQQLKLEERVRSNAELEMAQRNLSARVEEASLTARHAALDVDISRGLQTPRSIRAQGSLPWTLRSSRLPAMEMSPAQRPPFPG